MSLLVGKTDAEIGKYWMLIDKRRSIQAKRFFIELSFREAKNESAWSTTKCAARVPGITIWHWSTCCHGDNSQLKN